VPEIVKITSPEQLDSELASSSARDVWFFKHSLTCGVSSAAWREFEGFTGDSDGAETRFCLVEIQRARPVSQALAERLAVRHQSPQAILVRRSAAIWHASHWDITRRSLAAASTLLLA